MKSRRLSFVLLVVPLLTVSLAANVQAADPKPQAQPQPTAEVEVLPPQTELTPKSGGKSSGATTAQIVPNPYGCFGRSDRPHLSTHVPGSVAAEGWTICSVLMPNLLVRAKLLKQECVLFVCWWTEVDLKEFTKNWSASIKTVPWEWCNGTSGRKWRIESYHEATGVNGVKYTGSTANESDTIACN